MELKRNWAGVNPQAVAKCSEAHIAYLVEDAIADIVRLSLANREMLRALENLANAASATSGFASPLFLKDARAALAKAKGGAA